MRTEPKTISSMSGLTVNGGNRVPRGKEGTGSDSRSGKWWLTLWRVRTIATRWRCVSRGESAPRSEARGCRRRTRPGARRWHTVRSAPSTRGAVCGCACTATGGGSDCNETTEYVLLRNTATPVRPADVFLKM